MIEKEAFIAALLLRSATPYVNMTRSRGKRCGWKPRGSGQWAGGTNGTP